MRSRRDLSAKLHAAAAADGVNAKALAQAGVHDFLKIDCAFLVESRDMARRALAELTIGTDGYREPIYATIVRGVLAFLLDQDFSRPTPGEIERLKKIYSSSKPDPNALLTWFDEVFP